MGDDGAKGVTYLKSIGVVTYAQSEATCSVYGMPKRAIATGSIDVVVDPDEIRGRLIFAFQV